MKVTTRYEPPTQELDVEITVEDITRALKESPDSPSEYCKSWALLLNR
ncbi:hypothetical protein HZ994_09340 [Akkermansiaceae bacterium]|nr:hypothetical protein HZ994_09340 [Akkermansiaceae bacterium]